MNQINSWINCLIIKVTEWFMTPLAICMFLVVCGVLKYLGYGDGPLTYWLSVFAITTSQMILYAGDRDTKALQKKEDEVIRAIPEADDELIELEKKL